MKIPNNDKSYVQEDKITKYLLNEEHPKGKSKCKFFSSFGFSKDDLQVFIKALKNHTIQRDFIENSASEYGVKYKLMCNINTPDNRNPCIISVWIIENDNTIPKLVTAYPAK